MKPFILLLALMVLSIQSVADTQTPTVVEQLEIELGKIQSFEANFIQQRYSSNRGLEESTSGRFILRRPNQFMWQTFEPYAQTIVSNGEAIWTIDVDLEQVIISPIDEEIQNAPILLLANDQENLAELFAIEKQVIESEVFYILEPLDSSGNFERLRIGFVDETLSSFELYDSLGQLTRISMTNVRNNPVVDMSEFNPELPEDYDVIDTRPEKED